MTLQLWDGLLWREVGGVNFAYCPEHRMRLDIVDEYGQLDQQDTQVITDNEHVALRCPKDEKRFPVPDHSFWTYRRHYRDAIEAADLKDAQIVDVDGYQVPIAKAEPPEKDDEYWAEVRINDTKRGKQLVVYAGKRGDSDKAQMFLDLENDKITFDQNNRHPNEVFTRVTAEFKDGRKTTMEG